MARHTTFVAILMGLVFVSFAFAKPGTVRTKDGRNIEGEITDKGDEGVTVATKAGSVTIKAAEVDKIEYTADIKEAYEKRLAALPKDATAKDHFELARWLYNNKANELARQELDTALKLDGNYADAAVLKQVVDKAIQWERNKTGATNDNTKPPIGPAGVKPLAVKLSDRKLLEAEQINQIRMAELRDTDRSIRVNLTADVKKKFVEYDRRDVKEFAALSDIDKAIAILRDGTADMRKEVKILNDPASLAFYKSRVQPFVLNGCAALGCHGGTKGGTFLLYTPADNDAITYTNFYILSRYSVELGGASHKTIDRVHPNKSLILQLGLPRDKADLPHPDVQGWTPTFKSESDPRYIAGLDWIEKGLVGVEPNYRIDYTLPTGTKEPGAVRDTPKDAKPKDEKEKAKEPEKPKEQPKSAQNNRAKKPSGDDTRDALDEAQGRAKPKIPNIPVPVIPF